MADIEKILDEFRNEIYATCNAFYLWKGLNNLPAEDKTIYDGLNVNALSWIMIKHSLQTTFFIVLGRLFDSDRRSLSINNILIMSLENIEQFSKESLRGRRLQERNGEIPDWLDEYISTRYEPSKEDFEKIINDIEVFQKRYDDIYKPIRHKIYAHKDLKAHELHDELFNKTDVAHIEEFLRLFYQVQQVLWELFHNGRLTSIGDHSFHEEEDVLQDLNNLLQKLKIVN